MSRERELILEMLKDGKITNDEALKLLDAIGENKSQEKKNKSSNKVFDDSFVDKVTDSISKIGTKTEEAIKKLNLDNLWEGISVNIGSCFEDLNARTRQEYNHDLNEDGEVKGIDVENIRGRLDVITDLSDQIKVEIDIKYDERDNKNNKNDYYDIYLEGDTLKVKPKFKKYKADSYISDIRLTLPKRNFEEIKLENVSGCIEAEGLNADEADIEAVSGKVMVKNSKMDKANIEAVSGKVEIENISGTNLNASTVSGKVVADEIDYKNAYLETVSGKIEIDDIKNSAERIDIEVVSGSINLGLDGVDKPVKLIGRRKKRSNSREFFGYRFTRFEEIGNKIIAYTDDYVNDESSLIINVESSFGSVNID
uniref:DUF4097 family beta strand repeat-containing protein n=1 Tax=Ezakiella massiliensis TaxID=1852374 RepID=UPI00094E5D79|nr:DUF4097 family beta strand repeat-containing protein [Ezakiella massiliensis]